MHPAVTRVKFADFELDGETEQLWRNGVPVRLQPQPLRVLWMLATHGGQLVSRDQLRNTIWDTATFVEFDQGLNYCVRQIRLALHDDAANPTFVETVKRKGYRFIAAVETVPAVVPAPDDTTSMPSAAADRFGWRRATLFALAAVALVVGVAALVPFRSSSSGLTYSQVTSFSAAAFAPAISPDGRMIAFIVGSDDSFPTSGEIYTKMLPDGDPVRRTHDSYPKYGVAFSPDGSEITYTVSEPQHGWSTSTLSVLGGEPRLLMPNAAGLTWLDRHHLLFAEIKTGLHMGLVTATDSRAGERDVYLPVHERAMAHYGFASPDRRSVLVVEMGPTGGWQRCRLVPFDGRSPGEQVGPDGPCTSAAWSPDGAWMYFTAFVNGSSHVWRQRFPDGAPEQVTSGPADEHGVAMSGDGRWLLTSLGITGNGIWIHDATGDRLVMSEGSAVRPSFSPDGKKLYYLIRRVGNAPTELWVTDLNSGTSEPVIQGFAITGYHVSPDGRDVVFSARHDGTPQVWIASRDHGSAPRMLVAPADAPFFAADGRVVFRMLEGDNNYLFAMPSAGGTRTKVVAGPITELKGVSPDGAWAITMMPINEVPTTAVFAVSLQGQGEKRICPAECVTMWSPDGARFYVEPLLQSGEVGLTVVIPLPKGQSIPELPPGGIVSATAMANVPGDTITNLSRFDPGRSGMNVAPGVEADAFAYTSSTSHRNLFRIQLP